MTTHTREDIRAALAGTGWDPTVVEERYIRIWDDERLVCEVHRMPQGWLPALLIKGGRTIMTHTSPEYREETGALLATTTAGIKALATMPVAFYPTAVEAVRGIARNVKPKAKAA